jgi:hypothetical protein
MATMPRTSGLDRTSRLLSEHFRCPPEFFSFALSGDLSSRSGYFRFDQDAVCYGQCSSAMPASLVTDPLQDARSQVRLDQATVEVPFDPAQVLDNLRLERYVADGAVGSKRRLPMQAMVRSVYYGLRPAMPLVIRKRIQKLYLKGRIKTPFPRWPVDRTVETILERLLVLAMQARNVNKAPFIWLWPDGAPSCTMLTHDVETVAGVGFCENLMDLNDMFGIKSSFHIVPEKRYPVSDSFLEGIRKRGFEINVHDLNHDGHLFRDKEEFLRRAQRINNHARRFEAHGFRSAVMYRNVDWYDALDFSFDMSVPNVAHLDPQQGGCCTVFPFFVGKLVELPVTMTQDYSLFHILGDYSMRLWNEQISLIREKHGMISLIVHPDYIIRAAARRVYEELLQHLSELRRQGETWIALPSEVATWWRQRSELNLVMADGTWRIEGAGSKRARLAYAVLDGDRLRYELAPAV